MNWNELYSYIISHLINRNCAAYYSKKEAYLYLSLLLTILSLGLKKNEAVRLRQLYKRKLKSLERGELNSLPENSTDISIISRVIDRPGSNRFLKEIDRFQQEFDKKEKKLLELDALFHEADSILIDVCKDKIEESKLLEELFPHAPDFKRLLKKRKRTTSTI